VKPTTLAEILLDPTVPALSRARLLAMRQARVAKMPPGNLPAQLPPKRPHAQVAAGVQFGSDRFWSSPLPRSFQRKKTAPVWRQRRYGKINP